MKKVKLKKLFGILLIVLTLVIAYVISVLTSSFYQTNKKLLLLLICFFGGLALFWLIYGVLYLVTLSKISKKAKRFKKSNITCDDKAEKYFEENSYRFKYDGNKNFSQNASSLYGDALNVVKDIAKLYGNDEDKYYYLSYTIYDATNMLYGAIDFIDGKITPIFKFLRAEEKPLKIVERLLEKAVNDEGETEVTQPEKQKSGIIKKIGSGLLKATTFVLKRRIETTMTDVVKFVGFKAFEVYEKHGKTGKEEC